MPVCVAAGSPRNARTSGKGTSNACGMSWLGLSSRLGVHPTVNMVDVSVNKVYSMDMTNTQSIFFQNDKNGRKVAYRFSGRQVRSFRIGLAEAELLIATGQAVDIGRNPLKP